MFSMKSSLTHPQEAVGRARRLPVPAGVCRACYNVSRNNAQGFGHAYRNVNCTFTPRREPQRSQALTSRAQARACAGLPALTEAA